MDSRRRIYDCTAEFAGRSQFIGDMLSYKKIEIVKAELEEAKSASDALAVLVDPASSEEILEKFPNRAKELELLRVIDCLFFEGERLWPRCLYRQSFQDIVFERAPSLDTHLRCYIAGEHPLIPAALDAFARLGFREFYWISARPESIEPVIERMKKILLGSKIVVMKTTDMMLQANNGSLILNGVMSAQDGAILDDLAYLNFLKPPGMILDLQASAPVDWGVSEEDGRGFPIVTRADLLKIYDSVLVKTVLPLI